MVWIHSSRTPNGGVVPLRRSEFGEVTGQRGFAPQNRPIASGGGFLKRFKIELKIQICLAFFCQSSNIIAVTGVAGTYFAFHFGNEELSVNSYHSSFTLITTLQRKSMKRFTTLAAVAFFLAVTFPLTAQAQMESESGFKIGPRATIALSDLSDIGADFAIGADVRYDLSESVEAPIQLSGAFDYYFAEDQETGGEELSRTIFTVDLNGHYMIPMEGAFSPYAGAGIGITRSSTEEVEVSIPGVGTQTFGGSDSDVGLNLVGGFEFNTGSFRPFAQAQFTVGGDLDRFGLTGGVLFPL